MISLSLATFHSNLNARFFDLAGAEVVADYGDVPAEHAALRGGAGILDLSFRGRLCLTGADRVRFLHGQVTNDVNGLKVGEGCYAALITAKGKMISDLNVYRLENELLLDFEPGLSAKIVERLDQFIIADDVQVVDAAPHYGLLSVQGPKAAEVIRRLGLGAVLPSASRSFVSLDTNEFGEVCIMNRARLGTEGFDLFVPVAGLGGMAGQLAALSSRGLRSGHDDPPGSGCSPAVEARFCGWEAFEIARVESGIPRFGVDMDESNLPPEAGLEAEAISYTKGCYIGQEVISRVRAYGQVAKTLRGLLLADDLPALPVRGDKLFRDGKEVGFITTAVVSPSGSSSRPQSRLKPVASPASEGGDESAMLTANEGRPSRRFMNIALGYVRREANAVGTELTLRSASGDSCVTIAALPFHQIFP